MRDGAIAALLAALAFVPGLVDEGVLLGELHTRRLDLLGVIIALGQCLPLAVRRRLPGVCVTLIGICFSLDQALGFPSNFGSVGVLAALYSAGAYLERGRRLVAGAASAAYAVFVAILSLLRSPERQVDYLTFYLVLVAFWGAGSWVRARQEAARLRQLSAAEAAVSEERTRIARELHDVVTHHVTAMVVQADAARFLPGGDGPKLAEALTAIGGTGRSALAELRYLLGALNGPGDAEAAARYAPAPGRIADLVERSRSAGQPVEFVEQGEERESAGGPELAAYRIVQEALSNALKHAPRRRTSVTVCHRADEITVDVATDGPGDAAQAAAADHGLSAIGGGRGLAGLRQRAELFGGEFRAGALPGGGFGVHARLPLGDAG